MTDNTNEKPILSYNEKGFIMNYSVTRNEEIAYIDYETNSVTFKQMPLPIDKIREILDYFDKSKDDHIKYLSGENKDENKRSEDSK